MDHSELKSLLVAQSDGIQDIKAHVTALEADLALLKSGVGGTPGAQPEAKHMPTMLRDAATGKALPVFEHKQRIADHIQVDRNGPPMNVGRMLRGMVLGGDADDAAQLEAERKALSVHVDPSGGYTVPGALAGFWIDALRANMVLSQAGARTIPMATNSLDVAVLGSDPQAFWRSENATVVESEATFGKVSLQSKTVAAMVRLSLELAQDSANIEDVLQRSLTQALAHAIDKAGLVGETTNAAAAPFGLMNIAGRNKVTGIGAPVAWDFLADGMYELMLDNAPTPSAMIAHPALWKKMVKLKTGQTDDNTPLVAPAELAAVRKLYTTAAPFTGGNTVNAVLGDFSELLFGVRQQIVVRVLREAFMASNLQVAVIAYARCDFVPTREKSFCTLEGISV